MYSYVQSCQLPNGCQTFIKTLLIVCTITLRHSMHTMSKPAVNKHDISIQSVPSHALATVQLVHEY